MSNKTKQAKKYSKKMTNPSVAGPGYRTAKTFIGKTFGPQKPNPQQTYKPPPVKITQHKG